MSIADFAHLEKWTCGLLHIAATRVGGKGIAWKLWRARGNAKAKAKGKAKSQSQRRNWGEMDDNMLPHVKMLLYKMTYLALFLKSRPSVFLKVWCLTFFLDHWRPPFSLLISLIFFPHFFKLACGIPRIHLPKGVWNLNDYFLLRAHVVLDKPYNKWRISNSTVSSLWLRL